MQNHLTEMAALIAMELPQNSGNISEIQSNKLAVLKSVEPLTPESTLLGQYASYSAEARIEMKHPEFLTMTPTFAATHLQIATPKWAGVPFILVSGKKLDEKQSYVRVVFKDNAFCVGVDEGEEDCEGQKQIVFFIGGTDIRVPPMILVSKSLFKPVHFPKWKFEEITSDKLLFGSNITSMYRIMASDEEDAYSALVGAVFHGERHLFIDVQGLLASWQIWTPALKTVDATKLRVYDDDMSALDFKIKGRGVLEYVKKVTLLQPEVDTVPRMSNIPATFRDRILITDEKSALVSKLALSLVTLAKKCAAERGAFHMALPGGKTPIPLFQHLATFHSISFPWKFTHVWLTDERCVALDHPESNFYNLHENLLKFVNIPFLNIHPMPVHLGKTPCNDSDAGAEHYEAQVNRHVPSGRLDFILLGVGTDTHTASLFPDTPAVHVTDKLVIYTDGRAEDEIKRRMTFTLTMINQAHHVAVLVTDKAKHDLVHILSDVDADLEKHPVTGVNPTQGNMSWYIDHDALFGDLNI